MLTIVLTYRNRDLKIAKKCLDSIQNQTIKEFKLVLIDYGSDKNCANGLKKLVKNYTFIKLILLKK